MYEKIAEAVNKHFGYVSALIEPGDVEEFLREGSSAYITDPEGIVIEDYLDKFL